MTTLDLLNTFCPQPSYDAWREVVRAIDGQRPANHDVWNRIAGGRASLIAPPSEVYAAVGRGAGKSQVASIIAVSKAVAFRRPSWFSQRPFVGLFGRDQRQADELMAYARQLFEHPALAPLVAGDLAKRVITLKSGLRIEVLPSDWRKVRSRGYVCAVIDEAAFLDVDDNSAQQDTELLRALRPALGRVKGSLLVVISSKHARRGILYEASKGYGKDDPDTLYVEGGTLDFNPSFDARVIERAFREDPVAAASEFGREWRSDVAGLFTPEAIAAVTTKGVPERAPDSGITYRAFVDFAGGSGGDSATLAVAHTDRLSKREVLDAVREITPPFSPSKACEEFAAVLKRYSVSSVTADRWGAQFVVEGMAAHGIRVEQSAKPKSDLYLDGLPLINSGLVELLDSPKLAQQLTALERRAGGSVDHPPRGHDDLANAAVGALVMGRAAAGHAYHVGIIGVSGHHEERLRARREAQARERELEQLLPSALRHDPALVIDFWLNQDPEMTATEIAEAWRLLHASSVLPEWTPDLQRIANERMKGKVSRAA